MGLLDLLLWPLRTSTAIFVSILSVCVHVILSPFKFLQRLIKFFLDKFHQTITWTESKINYIKASKPLSYFISSPDNDVDLSLIPTTVPVLGLNEGHDKRSLAISRSTVRRRPPSSTRPTIIQSKCDKDQDTQTAINALIQELIDLSEYQPISSTHRKEEVDHSLGLAHTPKSDTNDEREKALQLIRELQELATSERGSKQQTQSTTTSDDGEEDGVSTILADLNVLETYLSQFVHEQEQDEMNSNYGRVSSLETITEEETSKESSPTFPSSPIPSRVCPTSYSSSEDVIEEKEVVTEADVDQALRLLQRVTGSEELQRMFKQIQDSRSGSGDIETELVSPTRAKGSSLSSPEIINKQFTETDREFQSVINSLEQQHKFIETQQELQNMINSMDPDNITSPTKTPPNSESPKVPEDQQIYDSLDPSPPIYSVPKKKSLPPPLFDEDKIYDSISANNQTSNMITPPPVPLRRTESDGGMSISSADLSPKCERRRHSLDNEEDGSQRYEGERHKSRRHKRPSSRHRHHCCHCDDYSPDRCSHHRPRSRERHSHHRHHRPRSGSDESRSSGHRRVVRESSGYESQELDSPSIPRRVGTPNSDVSSPSAPNTPKDGRRRFFGLFTKKSTSLTSLSSRSEHQDTSDRGSVSSYKM